MEKFLTKEQYATLKAAWASQSSASPSLHIIYNLLRAKPLDLGFTPFKETNLDKIRSNFNDRWNGFNTSLHYAPTYVTFADTTKETYGIGYPKYWTADQIEKKRQDAIASNILRQADFVSHFGLEPSEELCQRILAILKEGSTK
jgi:hypothetical protein